MSSDELTAALNGAVQAAQEAKERMRVMSAGCAEAMLRFKELEEKTQAVVDSTPACFENIIMEKHRRALADMRHLAFETWRAATRFHVALSDATGSTLDPNGLPLPREA